MFRLRSTLLVLIVAVPVVSSCASGDGEATAKFKTVVSGERLYEAYRKTGSVTTTVKPSRKVTDFVLSMDCVGATGSVKVRLTSEPTFDGFGEIPCQSSASPGGRDGSISLGMPDASSGTVPSEVTVTISGPKDGSWSAAVDTRDSE